MMCGNALEYHPPALTRMVDESDSNTRVGNTIGPPDDLGAAEPSLETDADGVTSTVGDDAPRRDETSGVRSLPVPPGRSSVATVFVPDKPERARSKGGDRATALPVPGRPGQVARLGVPPRPNTPVLSVAVVPDMKATMQARRVQFLDENPLEVPPDAPARIEPTVPTKARFFDDNPLLDDAPERPLSPAAAVAHETGRPSRPSLGPAEQEATLDAEQDRFEAPRLEHEPRPQLATAAAVPAEVPGDSARGAVPVGEAGAQARETATQATHEDAQETSWVGEVSASSDAVPASEGVSNVGEVGAFVAFADADAIDAASVADQPVVPAADELPTTAENVAPAPDVMVSVTAPAPLDVAVDDALDGRNDDAGEVLEQAELIESGPVVRPSQAPTRQSVPPPFRGKRSTSKPPMRNFALRAPPTAPPAMRARDSYPPARASDADLGALVDASMARPGVATKWRPPTSWPTTLVTGPAPIQTPSVLDRAIASYEAEGGGNRVGQLLAELEQLGETPAAAPIVFELGQWYERKLADEAAAVREYGRALAWDPTYRPNLWAIRQVFYRRRLWSNLRKLIATELEVARDAYEGADLWVELADVIMRDAGSRPVEVEAEASWRERHAEALAALQQATQLAPEHMGAWLAMLRHAALVADDAVRLACVRALAKLSADPSHQQALWLEAAELASRAGAHGEARVDLARAAELVAVCDGAVEVGRIDVAVHARAWWAGRTVEATHDLDAALERECVRRWQALPPSARAMLERSDATGYELTAAAEQALQELAGLRRRQAALWRGIDDARAWEQLRVSERSAMAHPLLVADVTAWAEELGRHDELAAALGEAAANAVRDGVRTSLEVARCEALLRAGQPEAAAAQLATLHVELADDAVAAASLGERLALVRKDCLGLVASWRALGQMLESGALGHAEGGALPRAAAALYVACSEVSAFMIGGIEGVEAARGCLDDARRLAPGYAPALRASIDLELTVGDHRAALALLELEDPAANSIWSYGDRLASGVSLAVAFADWPLAAQLKATQCELRPEDVALHVEWCALLSLADDEAALEARARALAALAELDTSDQTRAHARIEEAMVCERMAARGERAATGWRRRALACYHEAVQRAPARGPELWPVIAELARKLDEPQLAIAAALAWAAVAASEAETLAALRGALWLQWQHRDASPQGLAPIVETWVRLQAPRAELDALLALEATQARAWSEVATLRGQQLAQRASAGKPLLLSFAYADALERAAQPREALAAYERVGKLAEGEGALRVALWAYVAAADNAVRAGDVASVLRCEGRLLAKAQGGELLGDIAERRGWQHVVKGELSDAGHAFVAARRGTDPRGAMLGQALVAAFQRDHEGAAQAYADIADNIGAAHARVQLYTRAATTRLVRGDLLGASQLMQRASATDAAAPALAVLACEWPRVGQGDPRQQADRMVQRATLAEREDRVVWLLDAAAAYLEAKALPEAAQLLEQALELDATQPRGWALLRALGHAAGCAATVAGASLELARLVGQPDHKLALLRQALQGYAHEPHDAIPLWLAVLELDPLASEFEPLCRALRHTQQSELLDTVIARRLVRLEAAPLASTADLAALWFERARLAVERGEDRYADACLAQALTHAPDHTDALWLKGECALRAGRIDEGVGLLHEVVALSVGAQRQVAQVQLGRILDEQLHDLVGACDVLETVVAEHPQDFELRLRIIDLYERNHAWPRALMHRRALVGLRESSLVKAHDELHIARLWLDKLANRDEAERAVVRAHGHAPDEPAVVRELALRLAPPMRDTLLAQSMLAARRALEVAPRDAARMRRLVEVAEAAGDAECELLGLTCLDAQGSLQGERRAQLARLRGAFSKPVWLTVAKLPDSMLAEFRPAAGPILELWEMLAPAVGMCLGDEPSAFGFTRGDRLAMRRVAERYPAIVGIMNALAVGDLDVYVNEQARGLARLVGGDTRALCFTSDLAAGAHGPGLYQLGRTIALSHAQLWNLVELSELELHGYIVAALRAADTMVPAWLSEIVRELEPALVERTRAMRKHLSRKARAGVAEFVQQRPAEIRAVGRLREEALLAGAKAGALFSGELATVLDANANLPDAERREPLLLSWYVSESHVHARHAVGLHRTRSEG